jgi:hypothetical protein
MRRFLKYTAPTKESAKIIRKRLGKGHIVVERTYDWAVYKVLK